MLTAPGNTWGSPPEVSGAVPRFGLGDAALTFVVSSGLAGGGYLDCGGQAGECARCPKVRPSDGGHRRRGVSARATPCSWFRGKADEPVSGRHVTGSPSVSASGSVEQPVPPGP